MKPQELYSDSVSRAMWGSQGKVAQYNLFTYNVYT